MGLDLLDITYRIERELNVEISHDDLLDVSRDNDITVGALYDLLLKKMYLLDVARNDIRLNYHLWREIQNVLHSVTDVRLDQIELSTPLETLFPQKTRREIWPALRDACPYRVRKLDYPKVVRVVGFSLTSAMVLVEQFHLWQIPGARWLWPALALFGFWMFSETNLKILSILAPLRSHFPSGMMTVKDFCRAVLATNYADVCENVEIPLDQRCLAVWQQLTKILAETLGVDADKITFRSRLIRDLAMS